MKILDKKIENSRKSFTLIELLVVIAILGILASMILVSLGGAKERAKIVKAQAEVREIYNAILLLETDTGKWPRRVELPAGPSVGDNPKIPHQIEREDNNEIWNLSDSKVGLIGDDDNKFSNWSGPYMKVIMDPWGNPYFLDTDYDIDPGSGREWTIVIGSFGPNEEGPNQYDADNIIYRLTSESIIE